LENGTATYNIAPASITVTAGEEFDWLLVIMVGLIVIIAAWLVKRRLK